MFTHETKNLVGYIEGGLPPEAHSRVERHLETCHLCRAELAEMRAARRALESVGHTIPVPAYDSALWSRVHAQIARPRPAPRLRPRWALATGAFALTATAVCLVLVQDRIETNTPDGMLASRPDSVVATAKPAGKPVTSGGVRERNAASLKAISPSRQQAPGRPAAPPVTIHPSPVRMAAAPPAEGPVADEPARNLEMRRYDSPNVSIVQPKTGRIATREELARPRVAALTDQGISRGGPDNYYDNNQRGRKNDIYDGDLVAAAPPNGPAAPAPTAAPAPSAFGAQTTGTLMADLGVTSGTGGSRPDERGIPIDNSISNGGLAVVGGNVDRAMTTLGTSATKPAGKTTGPGVAPEIVAAPPPDYVDRLMGPAAVPEAKDKGNTLGLRWRMQSDSQRKIARAAVPAQKAETLNAPALRPATETGRVLYAEASTDLRRGRVDEAAVGFQKALDEGITVPEARVAHLRLGDAAVRAKDDATALKEYTAAVEIAKDAEALSKLGGVYERMGNIEKATNAYNQALIFNPAHLDARAGLARLKSRKR